MNSEHFERQMNFIVDQQAKMVVNIDRLHEAQILTDQKLSAAGEAVTHLSEVVTRLAYVTKVGFKDVTAKIDALVDSQVAGEESQKRKGDDIYAKLNALADSQIALSESQKRTEEQLKQTDKRLDRLAATVDRFLSNRQNGH